MLNVYILLVIAEIFNNQTVSKNISYYLCLLQVIIFWIIILKNIFTLEGRNIFIFSLPFIGIYLL